MRAEGLRFNDGANWSQLGVASVDGAPGYTRHKLRAAANRDDFRFAEHDRIDWQPESQQNLDLRPGRQEAKGWMVGVRRGGYPSHLLSRSRVSQRLAGRFVKSRTTQLDRFAPLAVTVAAVANRFILVHIRMAQDTPCLNCTLPWLNQGCSQSDDVGAGRVLLL